MTAILKEDIHSNSKGLKLYGKKGSKVKVIKITGKIAIVESKERFPVGIDRIKIIEN